MGNGYSIKQMVIAIVIVGIFTFVIIGTTSNAFKDDSQVYYEQVEKMIIHNAEIYGKTLEALPTEGSMIITVDDLVKAGYYGDVDKDGNVKNPLNSNGTLNSLKIKLVYQEDGSIKGSIIEEYYYY